MRIYKILQGLFVKKKEKSTKKAGNISSPFVVALLFDFYILMFGQHTVFSHGAQCAAVQIAVGIATVTKAFTIFSWFCACSPSFSALQRLQRLFNIRQNIVDIFNADRQTD